MDRRLFLASMFATGVDLILPPEKQLILDYTSTKNAIHRGVVVTDRIDGSDLCLCPDHQDPKRIMVMDAKRAWILPDGRLEVERYALEECPVSPGKFTCERRPDGEPKMYTTILDEWTFRKLNKNGETVYERHSRRT